MCTNFVVSPSSRTCTLPCDWSPYHHSTCPKRPSGPIWSGLSMQTSSTRIVSREPLRLHSTKRISASWQRFVPWSRPDIQKDPKAEGLGDASSSVNENLADFEGVLEFTDYSDQYLQPRFACMLFVMVRVLDHHHTTSPSWPWSVQSATMTKIGRRSV